MKKLISLVLAIMMIGLVGLAFAEYGTQNQAHNITITKKNATGARSYEAYQILKGNLSGDESLLADIQWGDNIDSAGLLSELSMAAGTSAYDFAKTISGYSAAQTDALATAIAKHLTGSAAGTSTDVGGTHESYTIPVSGDGYYFIKDVTANLPDGETASKFILNVVKDVTIQAKDTILTPDKKETVDSQVKVEEASAAIGDTVTFDVTITIPDTQPYNRFKFVMNDTLPKGLTFTGISSITAGTYTFTSEQYEFTPEAVATANAVNQTIGDEGTALKVVFKNFKSVVESNSLIGQTLTVTYTAVVNKNAVFGPSGNINRVKFDYSNDPTHTYEGDDITTTDPKGETPEDTTKTVVTALQINKVDGATNNPLAGAEFTVSGTAYNTTLVTGEQFVLDNANGTYWKLKDGSYTDTNPSTANLNTTQYDNVNEKYRKEALNQVITLPEETNIVGTTNDAGVLNISGLKPGTYTITETHAPDGYNKITETKTLVIEYNFETDKFVLGNGTSEDFSLTGDGVLYQITIANNQGTTLPSTGGIGTTIFYIVGGLLLVGAAIVLVARRKAEN